MASKTTSCGKTTVNYDDVCAYSCSCAPGGGCNWIVSCPDGRGGWIYTSGTGLIAQPPTHPHVTIAGTLELCAKGLEKLWKRQVIVPKGLRKKTIRRRTLEGTPEHIAQVLGVTLGRKIAR